MSDIYIHGFSKDDKTSIPFQLVPLEKRSTYDTSLPHRHNYYEIFIFENGGGTHRIDFTSHKVHSYSIHFVSPGQIHLLKRELDSNGFVILFSRDFYYLNKNNNHLLSEMPFLNNNHPNPIINLNKSSFEKFHAILKNIQKEYSQSNNFKETMILSYLNLFIIEAHRAFELIYKVNNTPKDSLSKVFIDFKRLLEENFIKWHKVSDYAKDLNISDKVLAEIIKKTTGSTALDTIHDRILLEAKRLLMHTDMDSKEIAYTLHFEDPSYFGKFFKSKVGESPNSFRKTSRKNYQF